MQNSNNVISLLVKSRQDKDVDTLLKACIDVHIPVFEAKSGEWRIRNNDEIIETCKKAELEAFQLLKQETYLAHDVESIESAITTYKSVIARLHTIIQMLDDMSIESRSSPPTFIEVFKSD